MWRRRQRVDLRKDLSKDSDKKFTVAKSALEMSIRSISERPCGRNSARKDKHNKRHVIISYCENHDVPSDQSWILFVFKKFSKHWKCIFHTISLVRISTCVHAENIGAKMTTKSFKLGSYRSKLLYISFKNIMHVWHFITKFCIKFFVFKKIILFWQISFYTKFRILQNRKENILTLKKKGRTSYKVLFPVIKYSKQKFLPKKYF